MSDEQDSDTDSDRSGNEQHRQEILEKLVPALPASEYGVMPPAFYENSQPVTRENPEPQEDTAAGPVDVNPGDHGKGAARDPQPQQGRAQRAPLLTRDQFDGVDSDDESAEVESSRKLK